MGGGRYYGDSSWGTSAPKRQRLYGGTHYATRYSTGSGTVRGARGRTARRGRVSSFTHIPAGNRGMTRTQGFWGRYGPASRSHGHAVELKFFDAVFNDAVISATGDVIPSLNLVAQGITEKTRIGRKMTITNLHMNYTIQLPELDAGATAAPNDTVRFITFIDTQCNGATAAVLDVLETADQMSFNNLGNSGRFRVLKDQRVNMNYLSLASDGAGVVSSAQVGRTFSFHKKLNLPIEFDAAAGAITEIRSNNIGVLWISSSGAAAAVQCNARIRFSDS